MFTGFLGLLLDINRCKDEILTHTYQTRRKWSACCEGDLHLGSSWSAHETGWRALPQLTLPDQSQNACLALAASTGEWRPSVQVASHQHWNR